MPSLKYMEALEQRCLLSALPYVSIGDAYQTEGDTGNTTAAVVVNLSRPRPKQAVTVNYATQKGSAIAGSDYVATSGKLTFAPGETSKTLLFTIKGDHLAESDEYFVIKLQGAKNAKLCDGQASITIFDDEPLILIDNATGDEGNSGTTPLNFTVNLSRAYDQAVTVNFATQDGDALGGVNYVAASGSVTFSAGQTTKSIPISVIGNRIAGPNTYFLVNLQTGTNAKLSGGQGFCTIFDDEPTISIDDIAISEGDSGNTLSHFTVSLSHTYDQPVEVTYSTADGSAIAGTDYIATSGNMTFAPGETSKAIPVSVYGDLIAGLDQSFSVMLQAGTNAHLGDDQGTATIVDDEPRLSISGWADYEGYSGTVTPFTFTVNLSRALNQSITVDYTTADYAATAGIDYEAIAGSLTFAPGELTKTISVQVYGNDLAEPDKYFTVTISEPSVWISNSQAFGSIFDDDGYYYYDPGYYYYDSYSYYYW